MRGVVLFFLALPREYFSAFPAAWRGGMNLLTLIPIAGSLALLAGTVAGLVTRQTRLLLFLVSVFASHVFVATAGFWHGQARGWAGEIASAFLTLQAAWIWMLVERTREDRFAAKAIGAFCASYALFAGLVATMVISNRWL